MAAIVTVILKNQREGRTCLEAIELKRRWWYWNEKSSHVCYCVSTMSNNVNIDIETELLMRESHPICFSLISCISYIDFNCTIFDTLHTCTHTHAPLAPTHSYSSKPWPTRKMALFFQNWELVLRSCLWILNYHWIPICILLKRGWEWRLIKYPIWLGFLDTTLQ